MPILFPLCCQNNIAFQLDQCRTNGRNASVANQKPTQFEYYTILYNIHTCLIIVILHMLVRSLLGISKFDSKISYPCFSRFFGLIPLHSINPMNHQILSCIIVMALYLCAEAWPFATKRAQSSKTNIRIEKYAQGTKKKVWQFCKTIVKHICQKALRTFLVWNTNFAVIFFLLQHVCMLVVFFHHLHTYEIERISSNNNLIKLSIGRKGRSPEKKMFTYAPELGGSCFFLPLILHQPAFYTKFTIVVYFYFKMAFHYRNQI